MAVTDTQNTLTAITDIALKPFTKSIGELEVIPTGNSIKPSITIPMVAEFSIDLIINFLKSYVSIKLSFNVCNLFYKCKDKFKENFSRNLILAKK